MEIIYLSLLNSSICTFAKRAERSFHNEKTRIASNRIVAGVLHVAELNRM